MKLSLLKWLKCHLFGRHNLRIDLTVLEGNNVDVYVECYECNFCQGCITQMRFEKDYTVYQKGKKIFNLTVIEGGNNNG